MVCFLRFARWQSTETVASSRWLTAGHWLLHGPFERHQTGLVSPRIAAQPRTVLVGRDVERDALYVAVLSHCRAGQSRAHLRRAGHRQPRCSAGWSAMPRTAGRASRRLLPRSSSSSQPCRQGRARFFPSYGARTPSLRSLSWRQSIPPSARHALRSGEPGRSSPRRHAGGPRRTRTGAHDAARVGEDVLQPALDVSVPGSSRAPRFPRSSDIRVPGG
jgi:hypothetical protein